MDAAMETQGSHTQPQVGQMASNRSQAMRKTTRITSDRLQGAHGLHSFTDLFHELSRPSKDVCHPSSHKANAMHTQCLWMRVPCVCAHTGLHTGP